MMDEAALQLLRRIIWSLWTVTAPSTTMEPSRMSLLQRLLHSSDPPTLMLLEGSCPLLQRASGSSFGGELLIFPLPLSWTGHWDAFWSDKQREKNHLLEENVCSPTLQRDTCLQEIQIIYIILIGINGVLLPLNPLTLLPTR